MAAYSITYTAGKTSPSIERAAKLDGSHPLLSEALAEPIDAKPVLALARLDGDRTGRGDVSVLNPKEFPALMREKSAHPLNPATKRRMKQIAHVLENCCRDLTLERHPEDE